MTRIMLSLPDALEAWVDAQTASGRFAKPSDYILSLIELDRGRADRWQELQLLVDEGIDSGVSERSLADVIAEARTTSLDR